MDKLIGIIGFLVVLWLVLVEVGKALAFVVSQMVIIASYVLALVLIVAAIVAVMRFAGAMVDADRKIVRSRHAIDRKWRDVNIAMMNKKSLIPKLEEYLDVMMKYEKEILEITSLKHSIAEFNRNLLHHNPTQSEIIRSDAQIGRAINMFTINIQSNHQDIVSKYQMDKLIQSLENSEKEIKDKLYGYSKEMEDFNTLVDGFPSRVIAGYRGLEKIDDTNLV